MKISVAMCTYNGEQFLKEQVDSILNQSVLVDEIIVCDDRSTDGTFDILKQFTEKHPNLFKIYKNEKNLGTIKNFEKAILLTTGDLIFLSDQDDIWKHNKVEIISTFFKNQPNCKLLFTNGDLINSDGEKLNSTLWDKWCFNQIMRENWKNNNTAFFDLLRNNNKITGATICFHKKLKQCLPIFGFEFYYHDAFMGIHAAAQNALFYLDHSLIYYRLHSNQQVGIANTMSLERFMKQNPHTITKEEFVHKIFKIYKIKKIRFLIKKIKMPF